MTAREWLRRAERELEKAGAEESQADAMVICMCATGLPRHRLRLEDDLLSEQTLSRLDKMLASRARGEPVQYATGEAYFMGLRFSVDRRVLIPRQDTEILAEAAIAYAKFRPGAKVLDLCCGSGCIGLSVAKAAPCRLTLADIDEGALACAAENGSALGIPAEYVRTDLFSALSGREFDLITCNPPYIPEGDIPSLSGIVQREPRLALSGGQDGLDFYRALSKDAPAHLLPGGQLMMEIGAGQSDRVRSLFGTVEILPDLSGIPRTVIYRKE